MSEERNEKFTRGPWKVSEVRETMLEVQQARYCGEVVARVFGHYAHPVGALARANASLIAAAPEMFAYILGECKNCALGSAEPREEDCCNCELGKLLKKARGEA